MSTLALDLDIGAHVGLVRAPRSARLVGTLNGTRHQAQAVALEDEELVRCALAGDAAERTRLLDVLFRRYERRVAAWCLRLSGRREEAADLAQDVFLRVHERLDGFRGDSKFSTWLYMVVRSVVINKGQFEQRRRALSLDDEDAVEPTDETPGAEDETAHRQLVGKLNRAVVEVLDAREAEILRLHYVDALSLPAIDRLLGLENRSGAKAYLVSAKRKLRRHFEKEEGRS